MDNTRILIDAGLSEEQALTYDALLEKGPLKASSIAKWTGIKRSLVYKVLEQLINIGLVSEKGGKGAVSIFSPNHPSLLLNSFEQKEKQLAMTKEILSSSIGTLSSKFNLISGKPNVQFYEGINAIEKITMDLPVSEKEIRQFLDINNALNKYSNNAISSREKRIKLGIVKKMIVPNTPENKEYISNKTELTKYKISETNKLPTGIQIYDNKVTMLNITDNSTVGVIIEDELIAQTFKNIFDQYWNLIQ